MNLNYTLREEVGSGKSGRLRNEGQVPAVIYGNGFPTHNIILNEKEILKVLKTLGENAVVNLDLDGGTQTAMIKEIQRKPITNRINHIDLQQVDDKEKIQVEVPVTLVGKEHGIEDGVLQQQLDTVLVECLAINIPRTISVNIDDLEVGGNMTVADLYENENYIVLNESDEVIASIIPSTLNYEEEPAAGAVDAAAVPEIDEKAKNEEK